MSEVQIDESFPVTEPVEWITHVWLDLLLFNAAYLEILHVSAYNATAVCNMFW
jgi:hypothetical protein